MARRITPDAVFSATSAVIWSIGGRVSTNRNKARAGNSDIVLSALLGVPPRLPNQLNGFRLAIDPALPLEPLPEHAAIVVTKIIARTNRTSPPICRISLRKQKHGR
ncbi:MAG: hypothetical protein ACU0DI_02590 [Paracoccaceae bacterium]